MPHLPDVLHVCALTPFRVTFTDGTVIDVTAPASTHAIEEARLRLLALRTLTPSAEERAPRAS